MDDTISRQQTIDAILDMSVEHRVSWKDAVIDVIDELPSAQPEIIHCKDCIWHNKDINQCQRQICAVMYADDFCNYGERRGKQDG